MNKLKPCPFCGKEPKYWFDNNHTMPIKKGFNIACPVCDVRCYSIEKEDCIKMWNTRTTGDCAMCKGTGIMPSSFDVDDYYKDEN